MWSQDKKELLPLGEESDHSRTGSPTSSPRPTFKGTLFKIGHEIEKAAKKAAAPIQKVVNNVTVNNTASNSKEGALAGDIKTKFRGSSRIGLDDDEFSVTGDNDIFNDDEAPTAAKGMRFQAHDFHVKPDDDDNKHFHKYYHMGKLLHKTEWCRIRLCRSYLTKQDRIVKIVRENISTCHEFEMLKNTDHPNIPTVYELFQGENNQFFIVMEYYQGGTLLELLEGTNKINPTRILEGGAALGGFVHETVKHRATGLVRGGAGIIMDGFNNLTCTELQQQQQQPMTTKKDQDGSSLTADVNSHRATTGSKPPLSPQPGGRSNPRDNEWDLTLRAGQTVASRSPTRPSRSPNRTRISKSPKRRSSLEQQRQRRISENPNIKNRRRSSFPPQQHQQQQHQRQPVEPQRQGGRGKQQQQGEDDDDPTPKDPHQHIQRKLNQLRNQKNAENNSPLSEDDAKLIMLQLLRALRYCHENGIIHCNIKCGNIMFKDPTDYSSSTLIDFEASIRQDSPGETLDHHQSRFLSSGHDVAYLAPEVVQTNQPCFGEKSDVWSSGITLYKMLSNTLPFVTSPEDTEDDIRRAVRSGRSVSFPDEDWVCVSNEAKDYVKYLLNRRPDDRPCVRNAISHTWLAGAREKISQVLDPAKAQESGAARVLHNLRRFNAADTKMKEAVCSFIASHLLTQEEIKTIDQVFQALDTQHDGRIHRFELKHGYYKVYNKFITERELDAIMKRLNHDGTNKISYSEFKMAAVNKKDLLSRKRLKNAFELFDRQGKGYVTHDELRDAFQFDQIDMDYLNNIILKVDKNNNGKLDFEEFVKMMTYSDLHDPHPTK
jgi:serine/threonine protein kinase